jgi:type III secretion protein V
MAAQSVQRFLRATAARQDVVLASAFIFVVIMMVVPLPTVLVDSLIAANLALTLLVLVSATYMRGVLDLSTFPSIILVTTVFRLALTVSTSRLILTTGDAGHIVRSFGEFVVSGNVLVGLVLFLIIAAVQFIVVTKGSERIAEVAARFTLDAMPGKQMAIDGDYRAGDITKEEARRRRGKLDKESQFFGSMDGAMKFVKGDAIASLIIVFVNLVGGLSVGVLQHGMTLSQAGHLYTLLTVGDGLVAQIPSMFIAIAAGTVVTRISLEDSKHLGTDIMSQLSAEPKALAICAAALFGLAVVPGFPTSIFLALAAGIGCLAMMLHRRAKAARGEKASSPGAETAANPATIPAPPTPAGEAQGPASAAPSGIDGGTSAQPEPSAPLPRAAPGDSFTVRAAPAELAALGKPAIAAMLEEVEASLKTRYGFVPGRLGFAEDASLPAGTLAFDVEGVEEARASVEDGASWFEDPHLLRARLLAWRRRHAAEAFGFQDATRWLDDLQPRTENLVAEVRRSIPMLSLTRILRNLLREDVPLAQSRLALEAILASWHERPDTAAAVEVTRLALRRQIVADLRRGGDVLRLMALSPKLEETVRALCGSDHGEDVPSDKQALDAWFSVLPSRAEAAGANAVVTSQDIRGHVAAFLERKGCSLGVLGFAEIPQDCQTDVVALVGGDLASH